jgi:twitching motility protein PilT
MDLVALLGDGVRQGASDFHLAVGERPIVRVRGELFPLDHRVLDREDLDDMTNRMLSRLARTLLAERGAVDFPFSLPGVGRFRVNLCRARGSIAASIRSVTHELRTIKELNLPPIVAQLALEPRGLVLVTGAAGSGKTTTLAAMVRYINEYRKLHVVTVEDPIEYLHRNQNCVITQREIGSDTPSFADALRACLRQDPNVLVVGEMRDLDTVRMALTFAETGHLVLSSLHTMSAAESVNRLVAEFPPYAERQVRHQLAQILRGIICLRLVERADRSGVIPATEILVNTATIQRCIEDPARTASIATAIAEGGLYGMQTFDQCLLDYQERGLVSLDEALRKASSPTNLEVHLNQLEIGRAIAARPPARPRASVAESDEAPRRLTGAATNGK